MKIVVLGGTGVLGRHVTREAAQRGHLVRVVSRHAPRSLPDGARHIALDLAVRAGRQADAARAAALDAALTGADAVIDTVGGGRHVLVDGLRALLEEEARRGVGHHVTISIVGCDVVPMPYYRTKVQQEGVVTAGPVPWSVLRATQFHDLVARLLAAAGKLGLRPTGRILLQPVEPAALAPLLVDAAEQGPAGRLPDVGGPQVASLGELSALWARSGGGRRLAVPLPVGGKVGAALKSGGLCLEAGGRSVGADFGTWLAAAGTP
ncbi:MAG TPA: SDR family oxidoreductase [Microbacteriaceae bacterium]|nr:SDR family oxidoreductase [Microbacteriaceae bacterium]